MISIVVEKAHGDYDPGTSKFFGAPTCPDEWLENGFLGDDDFFFCQLNISEFKKYDSSGLLPEKGFIFVFLSNFTAFHLNSDLTEPLKKVRKAL